MLEGNRLSCRMDGARPYCGFHRCMYGDMSAAGICILHVLSKVACLLMGCCEGLIMYFREDGTAVRFPCREFEILANAAIFVILLVFEKKKIAKGMLWELYICLLYTSPSPRDRG